MTKLSNFTVLPTASIKDALLRLDKNKHGIILIVNKSSKLLGVATDGDIRRKLVSDFKLSDAIKNCMNTNFVSVDLLTPRESVIKKFDNNIKVIPVVNSKGILQKIYTLNDFPVAPEKRSLHRFVFFPFVSENLLQIKD